jgi:hypothetical protein
MYILIKQVGTGYYNRSTFFHFDNYLIKKWPVRPGKRGTIPGKKKSRAEGSGEKEIIYF